ncbi:PREDICTED: LOB domain-containing protein 29-like [Nelumbo nucifera]|uniref:LOB domain-containing protein 29-like n=2 Tax=Nelumbo nucifera TaxID=4432 RepID=A0A1U8A621_NELNU|nr:PREDICTED: LOB domain-containing protein 29-like [Nelumbo nucifera]DAD26503.1 TPA_asm: hypothetical protein HUJ06_027971 [Nelumbo nucifera]
MAGVGSSSSSCGACKFLRRKCSSGCVFAPYFCYEQGANHFAAVHKVFGASNVSKLLSHLPVHNRSEAALTISYEALARMGDPIYGCVAHILALQQQVAHLKEEIEFLGNQVACLANDATPVSRPSCQAQTTTETANWFQVSSQRDTMDVQYGLNHQPLFDHNLSHAVKASTTTGTVEIINSEMNAQLPPLYMLDNQNLYCHTTTISPNGLERLSIMGVQQEILPSVTVPLMQNTRTRAPFNQPPLGS